MGVFEDFLGGGGEEGIVRQFLIYGVGYELARSLIGPFINQLTQELNALHPTLKLAPPDLADLVSKGWISQADAEGDARLSGMDPHDFDLLLAATKFRLPPADLADMVVKGWIPQQNATDVARLSGVDPEDFGLMVQDAGEPIGLQDALFAWRRGYIPFDSNGPGEPSVETAIKTSHIADLWQPTIKQLGLVPIGVSDAVDAVVEGQIPYDQGQQIAYQNGVSNDDFRILYNTRGNPPGPADLIDLVRRGYIPMKGTGPTETTLEQGIFEGATKDKWEPLYEKLTEYLPPPRTITALQRAGSITADMAQRLYQQSGLSAELAAAYVADASNQKVAADKLLAKSDIEALYKDALVTKADALSMLASLGYDANEGNFLLSIVDMEREMAQVNGAISKIKTLFTGHKISSLDTTNALNTLGVPADQVGQMIQTWQLEATANVRLLTEAQIVDAWSLQLLDQATAVGELENLGYSPLDSWTLLSIKNKAPLPDKPPPGPAPGTLIPPPSGR